MPLARVLLLQQSGKVQYLIKNFDVLSNGKILRFFKTLKVKTLHLANVPHFYTLLIEGILVLAIRVQHLEILIEDPRFSGDIWSARNSKTFELSLSVREAHEVINNDCVFRDLVIERPLWKDLKVYNTVQKVVFKNF